MRPSWTTVAPRALLLAAGLSLAVPAVAAAQGAQPPSVRLTPARAQGVIERGLGIGPFTISNATPEAYAMRVLPVLLGQDRRGGLHVRDDAASLREAAARLAVQVRGFAFPPGAARSVFGRIRSVRPGQGFYGGMLFRATPTRRRGRQITNVLQLNARITLDPPPARRRVAWQVGALRAQQEGPRRLRLLVPVTNRGNTFALIDGLLRVRARGGRLVAVRPLAGLRVLPGAVVDVPTLLTRPVLPAGDYSLEAILRGAGRAARGAGRMELFGPNEVRTELARLVEFPAPRAYIGEETEFEATFRNTGNVRWEPRAQLEVRALRATGPGPVLERVEMDSEAVAPGARGAVSGRVRLPEGTRSFDVRVRLLAGGRELDARSNGVTPVKRPPLTTRVKDFVTENAIVIVALILGLVAIVGVLVGRYIRRLQAAARR